MKPPTQNGPNPEPDKSGKWVLPGLGLLQGLAVTGKNMLQSFYKKERMTTVPYPEQRAPISPNYRNIPFLCYDDDPEAGLRCTACKICEKSCPPECIYIVMDRDENGKALKRPRVFDIDASVCMGCGLCAEVCPFDSIYMDGQFELATDDRFEGLQLHLDDLAKSAEYHLQLRPKEASEVLARRKADAEKKAAKAAAKAKADAEKKAKAEAEQTAKTEDPPKEEGGSE
jgi:NADH-quinone oxidoreductase subunit I